MIALGADLKVVVASQPIDFRRGVNGLVALVAEALKADPYCGDIFVFRAKRNRREHPTAAGRRLFAYLVATGLMLVARR